MSSATHDGKVAIITGAGKGLGRAYAVELAARGASVVVNNRSHDRDAVRSADAVTREIRQNGGRAVANYMDVREPDCGEQLLAAALDAFGGLDIFIANAGVSEGKSFAGQSDADFRETFDINFHGTVNSIRPAFSHFYAQRSGRLVLSTSTAGLYGEHGLPAYSASKAALLGLMRSLSLEGAPHNVLVNAIAPYAATAMTRDYLSEDLAERMSPEHVARTVAWLVCDDTKLSGETLIIGGDRLARACTVQTGPLSAGGIDAAAADSYPNAWLKLLEAPLQSGYKSAIEHFKAFLASGR